MFYLHMESKKTNQMSNRGTDKPKNRLSNTEDKLVVARVEVGGGTE